MKLVVKYNLLKYAEKVFQIPLKFFVMECLLNLEVAFAPILGIKISISKKAHQIIKNHQNIFKTCFQDQSMQFLS